MQIIDEWKYKGFSCKVEADQEDDNIKAYHSVVDPNGVELRPCLSSYDFNPRIVELWIDVGIPGRQNGCNWRRDELEKMVTK